MGLLGKFKRKKEHEPVRPSALSGQRVGRSTPADVSYDIVSSKLENIQRDLEHIHNNLPNPFRNEQSRELRNVVRKAWLRHFLSGLSPDDFSDPHIRRDFVELRDDLAHPALVPRESLVRIERALFRAESPVARELLAHYYLKDKNALPGDALKHFLSAGAFTDRVAEAVVDRILAMHDPEKIIRPYYTPQHLHVSEPNRAFEDLIKRMEQVAHTVLPKEVHEEIRRADDPHAYVMSTLRGKVQIAHSVSPRGDAIHPHIDAFVRTAAEVIAPHVVAREDVLSQHREYHQFHQEAEDLGGELKRYPNGSSVPADVHERAKNLAERIVQLKKRVVK